MKKIILFDNSEIRKHPFFNVHDGESPFYEWIKKKLGIDSETQVDCRHICVAGNIQDFWIEHAKAAGLTNEHINTCLLMWGPKADESLSENEISIEDGFTEGFAPENSEPDYISESGSYVIPVQWSVYSTVKVKAGSLREAKEIMDGVIDEIPMDKNPEYIEGSYEINGDSMEELIEAQNYAHIGRTEVDENGEILS